MIYDCIYGSAYIIFNIQDQYLFYFLRLFSISSFFVKLSPGR